MPYTRTLLFAPLAAYDLKSATRPRDMENLSRKFGVRATKEENLLVDWTVLANNCGN